MDGAVFVEEGVLAPAQDPNRWDAALIAEAKAILATTGRTPPGPYRLQAAIALAHTRPGGPDWPLVAELHAALRRAAPSSTALVNHAFAAGRADGPDAGLRLIAEAKADPRLARYAPLHALEASLLADAGRPEQAADAWRRALALVENTAHRRLIEQRLPPADATATDPRSGAIRAVSAASPRHGTARHVDDLGARRRRGVRQQERDGLRGV